MCSPKRSAVKICSFLVLVICLAIEVPECRCNPQGTEALGTPTADEAPRNESYFRSGINKFGSFAKSIGNPLNSAAATIKGYVVGGKPENAIYKEIVSGLNSDKEKAGFEKSLVDAINDMMPLKEAANSGDINETASILIKIGNLMEKLCASLSITDEVRTNCETYFEKLQNIGTELAANKGEPSEILNKDNRFSEVLEGLLNLSFIYQTAYKRCSETPSLEDECYNEVMLGLSGNGMPSLKYNPFREVKKPSDQDIEQANILGENPVENNTLVDNEKISQNIQEDAPLPSENTNSSENITPVPEPIEAQTSDDGMDVANEVEKKDTAPKKKTFFRKYLPKMQWFSNLKNKFPRMRWPSAVKDKFSKVKSYAARGAGYIRNMKNRIFNVFRRKPTPLTSDVDIAKSSDSSTQ